MKITKKILFWVSIIPCSVIAMDQKEYARFFPGKNRSVRSLSTYLSIEPLPSATDRDKTIVRVIKNLSIITAEDKNYVDIDPLNDKLKDFEEKTNQHWDEHHKKKYEIEILKQKEHYQAKEYGLNNQLIELMQYKIASLESQTFFHRYPVITWGLGVSFGIAISLGLFKLCNWVQ